jgi:hypothetical protein
MGSDARVNGEALNLEPAGPADTKVAHRRNPIGLTALVKRETLAGLSGSVPWIARERDEPAEERT